MPTFKIMTNELLAALVFASTDDTRYILNGVCIELRPNYCPLLIATDGRRLACIQSQCEQEEPLTETASLVLSTDAIKAIAHFDKKLGKVNGGILKIEYRPSKRILVHFAGGKIVTDWEEGALREGDYPNWRQVVPTGEKSEVKDFGVNAEYVSDFVKAAKFLDVEPCLKVNLFSKETAFEIKLDLAPYFYAVLMPMKSNKEETNWQPEFLGMPKPVRKAA